MSPEDRIRGLLMEIARTGRDPYGIAGLSSEELARRTMENPPAHPPEDWARLSANAMDAVNASHKRPPATATASRPAWRR